MLVYHVAHNHGVFLSGTEHYGLLVRIYLCQKLLNPVLVPILYLDVAIGKILLGIYLLLVNLTALHHIAHGILIVVDVARGYIHAERHEKAVLYALFQRVAIHRLAKVVVCVRVLLTARRCRHAKLTGIVEILHQLSPFALVVSTSTMALVNNDEVKEILRVLRVVRHIALCRCLASFFFLLSLLLVGRGHHCLEYGEVQIPCRRHLVAVLSQFLRGNAAHGILVKLVKVVDCLICKNIPVGYEQYSRLFVRTFYIPFRPCQFPTNLKRCVCFSRASRHSQQNAFPTVSHSI